MGLKKNVIYSSILTCSMYIFQFTTYPYVARVLGVNNIGICNFAQSFVNYFILFSMLGISTLGVREIAKCNGDKKLLNETFSKLFTLNLYLTLISLSIYIACIELIPQLFEYKKLLYIGAIQIFLNLFLIEWLFKGLENFKYVTMRSIVIRLVFVISIFIFIRTEDDYFLYFVLSTGMIVGNALINWFYRRNFVQYSIKPIKDLKVYLRSLSYLGSQLIFISMYTTLNVVYLGFIHSSTDVSYYTTATKIQNIILALFSTFTLAVMPRISALSAQGDMNSIRRLTDKSFNILYAFAFPVIILVEFFSPEITLIVAGEGYENAALPLRIVTPLILIIGLEQILINQILVPLRKDKAVFTNALVGAATGLLFNILLVSSLKSVGSSIVWCLAEIAVLITACFFVKKTINYTVNIKTIFHYLISYIPLAVICFLISCLTPLSGFMQLTLAIIVSLTYSHMNIYYWIKEPMYIDYFNHLMRRLYVSK